MPDETDIRSILDRHIDRKVRRPSGDVPVIEPPASIHLDVDLDRDGNQSGSIRFPHSPNDDAWGAVLVPIVSIRNGGGPVLLAEAGNHGDEYEGAIALLELARELDWHDIKGQLILLPAVNAPAARVGRRCSPVDGLNFNRCFPGDFHGSISRQIAAYVYHALMPRAQVFLDLHSGGGSLEIMPSNTVEVVADPQQTEANLAGARAFGASHAVFVNNLGEPRTATAAASRRGLVTTGTEMMGGGFVDPQALRVCKTGIRNVMRQLGMLDEVPVTPTEPEVLSVARADAYHLSMTEGVFERRVALAARVDKGDLIGLVHDRFSPGTLPAEIRAAFAGTVYALRHPAMVSPGNCCVVLAEAGRRE
ncbi:succinylglutamate desuccinylase/aspartoacylase family protein [Pararhizobium mangrovi]|uniref:Succinylglutamate desuccinylase n=1 Tax=Pararhizobium mangrovi TaxID=2590452 RepID=A0A506U3G0_9HYPH|nr:succinylglutamate desuccinylase/aspartoacylase family protein [Pararhizobium mangrovi]TPW27545.1 succinylglutamate desuccinylase [Pararhizobium mangrovi]